MNDRVYGVVKEVYILGTQMRVAYGIALYANADSESIATVLMSFSDITSDEQKINELVLLCNQYNLSPLHLADILEDYLAQ